MVQFAAVLLCERGCGRFADPSSHAPTFCASCAPDPTIPLIKLNTLSRRYSVSIGQLNAWFAEGCGINGCPCPAADLHVDHNHDCCVKGPICGKCVRGVLCTRHNVGLEAFLDSPTVIAYLQRTAAGRKTLADHGLIKIAPETLTRGMIKPKLRQNPVQINKRKASKNRRRQQPPVRTISKGRRRQAQRLGK